MMTLPSFTAEGSLYRTSGRYHMVRAHYQINGTVYPAWFPDCPMTLCYQGDSALPGYGCEICYFYPCEGPVLEFRACTIPPPDEPLPSGPGWF